jgi:hypothetical protein
MSDKIFSKRDKLKFGKIEEEGYKNLQRAYGICLLSFISILILLSPLALSQGKQSHPLSQITPIDITLNMSNNTAGISQNITGVGYLGIGIVGLPSYRLDVAGSAWIRPELFIGANLRRLYDTGSMFGIDSSLYLTGDIQIGGNDIMDSGGVIRLTLGNPLLVASGTNLNLANGDLQIGGTSVITSARNIINVNWVNATNLNSTTGIYGGFVRTAAGSASAPSFSFITSTNTGMFSSAANTINFATGGTTRLTISTSAFTGTLPWRGQDGTASAPALSFSADTNTGIFRPAANAVAISTGGAERMRITNTTAGEIRIGIGTTAPVKTFDVVGDINATAGVYGAILYEGGTALSSKYVPQTRTLTAGAGLTGGGDLSADRSFAIAFSEDFLGWRNLTNYPAGCGANEAVQAIGDTLTCVPITPGGSGVTGSGTVGYIAMWNGTNSLNNSIINQTAGNIWITSGNLNILSGALQIAGTTVIDSSRNLVGINLVNQNLNMNSNSIINAAWVNATNLNSTTGIYGGFVRTAAGSASAPSFSFITSTNTGMFSSAANTINFATGGTTRLTISTSEFTGTLPWRGQDGTASAPALSFSADTNTGIFRPAANAVAISTGGAERMRITNTTAGEIRIGIGTTAPVKTFDVVGDINATAGIYSGTGYYVGTTQIVDSSRNVKNVQDVNATRFFQGSNRVIDTVTAGTGLTGGGSGPSVTLSIDTNVVPQKSVAETISAIWNFANGLKVGGGYENNALTIDQYGNILTKGNLTYSGYTYVVSTLEFNGTANYPFGINVGGSYSGGAGINGQIDIRPSGSTSPKARISTDGTDLIINAALYGANLRVNGTILPYLDNQFNLGSPSYQWANIYGGTIYEGGTALSNKYVPQTRQVLAGAGLTGGGDLSSDISFAVAFGEDFLGWRNLTNYPAGCGANQAVQAIGDTLSCIDITPGGSGVTGSGTVGYIAMWNGTNSLNNSIINQTAGNIWITSGNLNILSGALQIAGTTVIDSSRNLVGINLVNQNLNMNSNSIINAAWLNATNLNLTTNAWIGANLYFSPDVRLFRGAVNRLDLESGDSLNLVSGNLLVGGTTVITSDRIIRAANGNASTPALSFSADIDTGIFRPTADAVAISTGGAERMRITNTTAGEIRIGIGTTAPVRTFDVVGDINATAGVYGAILYEGGTALSNKYVPQTRQVLAGAGLTGGGDLSSDISFAVAFGEDFLGWRNLTNYPAGCGANQAVQAIGDTLSCIDITPGGSGVTGSGTVGYIAMWNGTNSLNNSIINQTAGNIWITSGNLNILSGALQIAGTTVIDSSRNLVGINLVNQNLNMNSNSIINAAWLNATNLNLTTNAWIGANLYFSPDVRLFRGAVNRLDLESGDSLNLVSGNLLVGGTTVITSDRIIRAANGNASTPALSFSADIDTGIFRPTADAVAISTGGAERMRITNTTAGEIRIGIGTTAPVRTFDVVGDINATAGVYGAILYEGGTALSNKYVPQTRQVLAGAGLTGGGDLSSDISFAVAFGEDFLGWRNLTNYPAGCGANQAVQAIGDTLSCIDITPGGSGVTGSGTVGYIAMWNGTNSLNNSIINQTAGNIWITSGNLNILSGALQIAGTTVIDSSRNLVGINLVNQNLNMNSNSIINAAWLNATNLNLTTNAWIGANLYFSPDVRLFRGAVNRLDLESGDSLNLVSGNLLVGGTTVITSDRIIRAANGNASTPALSFSADIDTGIFRPTADAVAISTGGAERMRITNTTAGEIRIGIGTTAPVRTFDVVGDINATAGVYGAILYEGGTALSNKYVPQTRQVLAGAGLTGGGDLSSDISFAVAFGEDFLGWRNLTNYPAGCGANQAVQAIGDTLSCIDITPGGSGVTGSGTVGYIAMWNGTNSLNNSIINQTAGNIWITSGNLNILSGALQIAGTTVIDSSRNLVGINLVNQNLNMNSNSIINAAWLNATNLNLTTNAWIGANLYFSPDVRLFRGAVNRLDLESGDSLNLVSGNLLVGGTTVITSDRIIRAANGNASTPALSFSADIDTGIFRPTADAVAISTGGAERMRITNTTAGEIRIGIGTTAPVRTFDVVGDINATAGVYGAILYEGGTALSNKYVPQTRQVLAGAGLTGGGDLSSDISFAVAFGEDFLGWRNLTNYPAGCGANQAVQAIGDTLSCIDITPGGSGVTGSGTVGYIAMWNGTNSLNNSIINQTAGNIWITSGNLNILSGALQIAGTTVIDSSRNLVGINLVNQNLNMNSNSIINAAWLNATNLNLTTNAWIGANLYFSPDVRLFRGAVNRLDLESGDSLNLVSGNLLVGGTTVITSDRIIRAANGNASTPALSFSADIDTGIFRPTADAVAISTGGAERMRITNTTAGEIRIGIGTTAPVRTFDVVGDINATAGVYGAILYEGGTALSNKYVPQTRQVLAGAGLTGGGDLSSDISFAVAFGEDFLGWRNLTNYPAGCGANQAVQAIGDTLSCIDITPGDSGVTGSGTVGYIAMWNGTNSINNSIIYQSGGNVGIGTTAPSYKLDIVGNIRATEKGDFSNATVILDNADAARLIGQLRLVNKEGAATKTMRLTAFANRPALELGDYDVFTIEDENLDAMFEFWKDSWFIVGKPGYDMRIASQWDPGVSQARNIIFGVPTSPDVKGTFTPVLTINRTGNVGIGTTDPAGYKLRVAGTVRGSSFYDEENTAYYLDPASTSELLNVNLNNGYLGEVGYIQGYGTLTYYPASVTTNPAHVFKSGDGTSWVDRLTIGGNAATVDVSISNSNFVVNSNQLYVRRSDGNVGIGTTAPVKLVWTLIKDITNDLALALRSSGSAKVSGMQFINNCSWCTEIMVFTLAQMVNGILQMLHRGR